MLEEQVESAWPSVGWRAVHVLVAVSGGPDSMALLTTLLRIAHRRPGPGQIFAAHVNHRLRPEADAEQRWIESECDRLRVNFLCLPGEFGPADQKEGDGLEAAARQIRYRLLAEMAESVGARFVAVGHTFDDQVETVLFRMLRGTGLRGMIGMPFRRSLAPSVTLVRPLLSVRRSTLQASLDEQDQESIRDASNADRQFRRNLIRLELLPWLRQHLNSDVDDAIWRLAAQATALNEVVEPVVAAALDRCRPEIFVDRGFSIDASILAGEPIYVVCEALRLAWRQTMLPEQAMTYARWRRLASLVASSKEADPLTLPGNVRATRVDARLHVNSPPS